MWCPDCKDEFATVPGSVVQVCPSCRQQARSGRRRRRVPKLELVASSDSDSVDHIHWQSDTMPIDELVRSEAVPSEHSLETTAANGSCPPVRPANRFYHRSTIHLVGFGLFVFLVGQALQIWAFLQEQFVVWSLANLVSIGGITVAFSGTFIGLRGFDRRLRDLARLVGRAELSVRPKRRTLRDRLLGRRN